MPIPAPTVDELVATIKHSSLPTILVEGPDDMGIYRWMQGQLGPLNGDFLPCGGRNTLLEIFRRHAEFAGKTVVFVADRDMWLFTSIPAEYAGIIWTEGYSIENDIYLHSDIERFLDLSEIVEHHLLVEAIGRWFAFEVEEHRAGRPPQVDTKVGDVVRPGTTEIHTGFIVKRGYTPAAPETVREVVDDYQRNIRGKQLFEMLLRFLSASGRAATHSKAGLYEICVKTRGHPNVARLMAEIRSRLDIPT
jgi:hypothetical protein